jgi:hypothetical protein
MLDKMSLKEELAAIARRNAAGNHRAPHVEMD